MWYPPVYLTIQKENKLFNVLHSFEKFRLENQEFGKDHIAQKIDLSVIHPSERKRYEFSTKIGVADYNF